MSRRLRGVYKRGRLWWICYRGFNGGVIRESTETDNYDDAVQFLLKRKADIGSARNPEIAKGNRSFNDLSIGYLDWAKRQRAFDRKKIFVKKLSEVFGYLPLKSFTTLLIEQYQTERLQKGNKPATVNRFISTLKHMFTKAIDWEMINTEVLNRIRKVKMLQENNKRLRYLSKEECQILINACDPHLKPIIITALNTGMRKSEILNLRWDNIDFNHGFILLDKTKNGERREIPINVTLRNVLKGITRRLDNPYVFYNPDTEKPYRPDFKRSFNTALRRVGIKDFHFHDLRHTFASHLVMAGVDITTVKELLGHKTLIMTLRYAHLAPSHKVKAMEILDTTINGKKTSYFNPTSQLLHNLERNEATMNGNLTDLIDEPCWDRTSDLLIKSQLLYQLS